MADRYGTSPPGATFRSQKLFTKLIISAFTWNIFFRFCKQELLLTAFQTPETACEEKWWHLVHVAYAQLWLARHLAAFQTRPWERYLPTRRAQFMSPTLVQRGFPHIIRELGTPAKAPKRRGISPGRQANTRLPPRPRQNVVVKGLQ